jgi:hypothetical protein
MSNDQTQHWRDLLEALQLEGQAVAGFGEVTVRLIYHDGAPLEIYVVERLPHYKLGRRLAPLTGSKPVARLAETR